MTFQPENNPFAVHQSVWNNWKIVPLNCHDPFKRVHNRFGGMRDLANFCGDIRDGN